jgi:hypothetical protein
MLHYLVMMTKIDNYFDHEKLKLKANENLHIRSVLADSKGRIWIGIMELEFY